MVGIVMEVCGFILVTIGGWRSYAMVLEAMQPIADDGDPTRMALEASRPAPLRPKVRTLARRIAVSIGWLVLASFGVYLIVRGSWILL